MPDHEELTRELQELGRSLPVPDATGMDAAVLARLDQAAPASRPRVWMRLAAVGLAILVALLLTPPVRAAIADWFGFGSVQVREDDGTTGSASAGPAQPTTAPGTSLEEAAGLVDFGVFELPALGQPKGAGVSADHRILSVEWQGGIRLDQSSSRSYTFAKTTDTVLRALVGGQEALWFPDSHDVTMINADGTEVPSTRRPAGRTLIWTIGDTTLRLEGDLSLARAVQLAESARPAA